MFRFPYALFSLPLEFFRIQSNASRASFIPRIPSKPASHADSFVQHAIQLLMYASNHSVGNALTSFFIGLDWYFAGTDWEKRHQTAFSDIYLFHQPTGAFFRSIALREFIRL